MNKYKTFDEILNVEKPQIENLTEKTKNKYYSCLRVLSSVVNDKFLDIPRLIGNKFEQTGYFYEIPFFDSNQLWESNNQIMLIVVYKLENKSSCCPLRIDMKLTDIDNWGIYIYDQSGERTIKITLIECESGVYYTDKVNYNDITLSDILKDGVGYNDSI